MGSAVLTITLWALLFGLVWKRATSGGMDKRIQQICSVRGHFSDVEQAVAKLLQTSEDVRNEWLIATVSLSSSSTGPVARETQLLEEVARQGKAIERQIDLAPHDIGQLGQRDLTALAANLRLLSEIAQGHQDGVDASRLRLNAFRAGANGSWQRRRLSLGLV